MFRDIALGLLVPALLTIAYMLAAIVQPRQWFDPQYTIPLLGMLLGNALNGVTIGVKAFLEALSAERAAIEWALAMGAGRFEAIWRASPRHACAVPAWMRGWHTCRPLCSCQQPFRAAARTRQRASAQAAAVRAGPPCSACCRRP